MSAVWRAISLHCEERLANDIMSCHVQWHCKHNLKLILSYFKRTLAIISISVYMYRYVKLPPPSAGPHTAMAHAAGAAADGSLAWHAPRPIDIVYCTYIIYVGIVDSYCIQCHVQTEYMHVQCHVIVFAIGFPHVHGPRGPTVDHLRMPHGHRPQSCGTLIKLPLTF